MILIYVTNKEVRYLDAINSSYYCSVVTSVMCIRLSAVMRLCPV